MDDESRSVIVAGARTPIGKFGGAFRDLEAVELGGLAIKAALDRAGVAAGEVEYVILGQVLQAGAGQITARQAAVDAGIPQEVPAVTINKVCLSGLNAIAMADQMICAGELETAVALNAARVLGLDEERVNVNGGPVALGHPIGASGARLALTLAHEMRRRGARLGGAALCGGGGQGRGADPAQPRSLRPPPEAPRKGEGTCLLRPPAVCRRRRGDLRPHGGSRLRRAG